MPRQPTPSDPDLTPAALRERDAARYIGLTIWFLRAARLGRCHGPAYIRAGRAVLYRRADLDEWLAAHRVGGAR